MAYTHYWYRPRELDEAAFAAAARDCARLAGAAGIPLTGRDGIGHARFESGAVAFNGVADLGYEPFVVERRIDRAPHAGHETPERMFAFCKTAGRGYDVLVQACLVALRHHLGRPFRVMSDGTEADWADARRLCRRVLGYGEEFRLSLPDDEGSQS